MKLVEPAASCCRAKGVRHRTAAQVALSDAGLTVDDLARMLRKKPDTVRGYLRGRVAYYSTAERLATILGMHPHWFLWGWRQDAKRAAEREVGPRL